MGPKTDKTSPKDSSKSSKSEIFVLQRKRKVSIDRLSAFERYMTDVSTTKTIQGLDGTTLSQIRLRLKMAEEFWMDFEETQTLLEELLPEEATAEEFDKLSAVRTSFEDRYFSTVGMAEGILEEFKPPEPKVRDLDSNETDECDYARDLRLPVLNLPTFSGDYSQWHSFISSFNDLVGNRQKMPPSTKLRYLKSTLKDDAADLVDNLDNISENYAVAIKLLTDRYENPCIMVQNHIRDLFGLTQVDKEASGPLRKLCDRFLKHVGALKALGQKTDTWDAILIHLLTSKLDVATFRKWQEVAPAKELPKLASLTDFLERRCQILDAFTANSPAAPKQQLVTKPGAKNPKGETAVNSPRCFVAQTDTSRKLNCQLCSQDHLIHHCQQFIDLSPVERYNLAKLKNLCLNCLAPGHRVSQCRSRKCKCGAPHHSSLHRDFSGNNESSGPVEHLPALQPASQPVTSPAIDTHDSPHVAPSSQGVALTTHVPKPSSVMLSTALVIVRAPNGQQRSCKALLDCGSQSSFVCSELCEELGLQRHRLSMNINCLNSSSTSISHFTELVLASRVTSYKTTITPLVVNKITDYIPSYDFDLTKLELPDFIVLADPNFHQRGKIEMLIGADVFWDILGFNQYTLEQYPLSFRESKLGWIACGKGHDSQVTTAYCHLTTDQTLEALDTTLKKFWEIETLDQPVKLSDEQRSCEEDFKINTRRNEDGRFVVKIPLREDPKILGNSKEGAIRRFLLLEKRFARNENLKLQYSAFINEYVQLGHMELVQPNEEDSIKAAYYVPHHPVFKATSTTTKLRVVFDFSFKSSEGLSLNDITKVGPTIQDTLYTHLLRARTYQIFICGDLEKMYRQVVLDDEQTDLQRIIWRENPDEPMRIYRLLTVSYGSSSAGWLSCRSLKQLALDHETTRPRSSKFIQNNFYLDDFLAGVHSTDVNDAITLKEEVTEHLASGGFHIRKWSSNSKEFLDSVPEEDREQKTTVGFHKEEVVRTLGLIWIPEDDFFTYSLDSLRLNDPVTKRNALSTIAKIFDPLGLLGPVIVKAKIFMQDLWKNNFDWDETLSNSLTKKWKVFLRTLPSISKLKIPRKLMPPNAQTIELHGMCDASMDAFGACVYIRCVDENGMVHVNLVTSKSCVAPVKTQSLPRLELCGALLLAELVQVVVSSMGIRFDSVQYWTDSQVVLSWLRATPSRWTTFVANRVSKIQDLSHPDQWKHISTTDNPADLVSRGVFADQMQSLDLWWKGPTWLNENMSLEEIGSYDVISIDEMPDKAKQKIVSLPTTNLEDPIYKAICEQNSYNRLVRIFAYCKRVFQKRRFPKGSRPTGPITAEEFHAAKLTVLRLAQGVMFPRELKELQHRKSLDKKSKLVALHPFLDSNGLIRVGGRLENSILTPDRKHPIVLSYGGPATINRFTQTVARHYHLVNNHVGPQSLLSLMRETYWPLNSRDLARITFRRCVKCFKVSPRSENQLMGNLPPDRVQPARPFYHTGVDYAGPVYVKTSMRRNAPLTKCYIAVFVCLCTKAVHLELVEDLTTAHFLAALKRFMSRRGKPASILSDNGTNFVGARAELLELENLWKSEQHRHQLIENLASEGVDWKFNPPRSPNFGGLWESLIKQIKLHLKKIIGSSPLTFCEYNTILTQVEACINSRPLIPMSSDPNDLAALTPAHFLIGDVLLTPPEPDLRPLPQNRLSRWQLVQQLTQHFWARWTDEYLQELQRRCKWRTTCKNLTPGTLVLLKDDQTPPLSWTLGRVVDAHPGADGILRVVTVRTATSTLKRNVRTLCVLPIEEDSDH